MEKHFSKSIYLFKKECKKNLILLQKKLMKHYYSIIETVFVIKNNLMFFWLTRCAVLLAKSLNLFEIPFVHLYSRYNNSNKSNKKKNTLISQSGCEYWEGEILLIKVVLQLWNNIPIEHYHYFS